MEVPSNSVSSSSSVSHHDPALCSSSEMGLEGLHFLWLELTEKCNLRCVHCYTRSSPELPLLGALGFNAWARTLQEAFDLGCRRVQFIGGEATMHPELPHLIDEASRLGYEFIEVFTNGVHFSKRLKEALVRQRVHLAFSYYSREPNVHDAVTLMPGSHKHTEEQIRWAVSEGLHVRANVVRTPANDACFETALERLHDLGVPHVQSNRVLSAGRGDEIVPDDGAMETKLCGYCWRGSLCVTSTGSIHPCPVSRDIVVGRHDEPLETVVNRDSLLEFRRQVRSHFDGITSASMAREGEYTSSSCTCTCTCICTCTCVSPGCTKREVTGGARVPFAGL